MTALGFPIEHTVVEAEGLYPKYIAERGSV